MTNSYDQGNVVRCSTLQPFTKDGSPIDPTNVFFVCEKPDGVTVLRYQYGVGNEIVRDGVGDYHVDVVADQPYTWGYRFYSTGAGQASQKSSFSVTPDLLI